MSAAGSRETQARPPQTAEKPGSGRSFAVLLGHVLRLQARSAAIWGVVLGAFGVMMVAIFPGIASGAGSAADERGSAARHDAGRGC